MPENVHDAFFRLPDQARAARKWLHASAIKGAFLLGQSHEKVQNWDAAAAAYDSALPLLGSGDPLADIDVEAQAWSLRLISRLYELPVRLHSSDNQPPRENFLSIFRRWAAFWAASPSAAGAVASKSDDVLSAVSGSNIWLAYFRTLSDLLAMDPHSPEFDRFIQSQPDGPLGHPDTVRAKLRSELDSVGLSYETFVLETTPFPRAGQRNHDVDVWVEAAMAHWWSQCGPNSAAAIGSGCSSIPERVALSRHTLQILYRAASKTFQSSAILRHLFTVHAHLAEFPLAVRAFDTYLEVALQSRDRSQRSGLPDPSHDDDRAIVWTIASAIDLMISFGGMAEAEKTFHAGCKLEDILPDLDLPDDSRARALRAIGSSKAHWARSTFDEVARVELHKRATASFQAALDPALGRADDPDTLFEYGLLLAELGNISLATGIIRRGLLDAQPADDPDTDPAFDPGQGIGASPKSKQVVNPLRLLQLCHLLALLLSSSGNLTGAARACDAVFVLLGLSGKSELFDQAVHALNDRDKEALMEVRMTQLAIMEQSDGVIAAIDASDRLFSLFVNIFGTLPILPTHADPIQVSSDATATGSVTTSNSYAAGPGVSSSGSIFGPGHTSRVRSLRLPFSRPESHAGPRSKDGPISDSPHRFLSRLSIHDSLPRADGIRLGSRRSGRGSSRSRNVSAGRKSDVDVDEFGMVHHDNAALAKSLPLPVVSPAGPPEPASIAATRIDAAAGVSESPSGAVHPITEASPELNVPQPWLTGHLPNPVFPHAAVEQRKAGVLIRVWLFVADLFNRGGMYDDAWGALQEATSLCKQLEADALRKSISARAVSTSGQWLAMESVDDLWADVSSATGALHSAQNRPFDALDSFELALSRSPNHCAATVGLSNILLDMHEGVTPLERPERSPEELPRLLTNALEIPVTAQILDFPSIQDPDIDTSIAPATATATIDTNGTHPDSAHPPHQPTTVGTNSLASTTTAHRPLPGDLPADFHLSALELHKIAARDRAYSLLWGLTRRAGGWNCADAWYALGRASQASGDSESAKNQFWWCVDLEERGPARPWSIFSRRGP